MSVNNVNWQDIPDDVILTIALTLCKPMQSVESPYSCLLPYVERPTPVDTSVYAYFSLLSTSKQFYRVCSQLDFDWLRLVDTMHGSYSGRFVVNIETYVQKEESLLEEPVRKCLSVRGLRHIPDEHLKRMIKTMVHCRATLQVVRPKVDRFMGGHRIVYRTPKTNKPYKGYVGMPKLKKTKIADKEVALQFKEMVSSHIAANKKCLALEKALHVYSAKIAVPRPIVNIWSGFV